MKNNKKIILIIVTFLVSIFLITNKAVEMFGDNYGQN